MTSKKFDDGNTEGTLKREIGLVGGVCVIVGSMIGSGIFISPVGVLENTGSIGASLIVWMFCGIIATFGSLTYAELGTMIPKSGAEYPYIKEAFGRMPAFLFAWTSSIVLKPSSVAIIAMVFGKYLTKPMFPGCESSDVLVKIVSAMCILLVAFINSFSVKAASRVQIFFTITKVLVLIIIVCFGMQAVNRGDTDNLQNSFSEPIKFQTLGTAFYQGFWAYDGWNQLNYITEELQNPYVNLPKAIWIGIPSVTFIYLLTNTAYLAGLSLTQMLETESVAIAFGDKYLGALAIIIPIGVAFSTFGGCNGYTITCPRITMTAARDGTMPELLAMVHHKKSTPIPAIIFNTVIAILVLFPNDFNSLVNYFSFSMWIFHGMSAAALIRLRYTQPNRHRPYKVPIVIPWVVILVAIFLVLFPIISEPAWEFLYAFMFIMSGLLFYVPIVHYQKKPDCQCFGLFTRFVQVLLQVLPVETKEKYPLKVVKS